MCKYDRLVARKDNIRLSGERAIMQTEAKPQGMEAFAQHKFRLGVGPTNPAA